MSESDESRHLAVGAGAPDPGAGDPEADVVQAVVDFVDDLVDEIVPDGERTERPGGDPAEGERSDAAGVEPPDAEVG